MKKILSLVLISVLIFSLIGCGTSEKPEDGNELLKNSESDGRTEDDLQGITVNEIDFERIEVEDLDSELQNTLNEAKTERGYKANDSNSSTLLETQIVMAEYVGQIDNNSIEVKIEDGARALRLNGIAKEQLAKLKLNEGDIVKLEVFKNENNQETVYSMEKTN